MLTAYERVRYFVYSSQKSRNINCKLLGRERSHCNIATIFKCPIIYIKSVCKDMCSECNSSYNVAEERQAQSRDL